MASTANLMQVRSLLRVLEDCIERFLPAQGPEAYQREINMVRSNSQPDNVEHCPEERKATMFGCYRRK
jgi:hypothetical protein